MVQTLHQELVTGREEQYGEERGYQMNGLGAADAQGAPGKCLQCWDFFGSPEYGGLCHGCFLKGTAAAPEEKRLKNAEDVGIILGPLNSEVFVTTVS